MNAVRRNPSYQYSALKRSLVVAGSALLLASVPTYAEAAIFTVEYAGSVSNLINPSPDTDLPRNILPQLGDRLLGRYTFDDTNNEVILARYLFTPPDSTATLDPATVVPAEQVFRQVVPPAPNITAPELSDISSTAFFFTDRSSTANQNSAQYEASFTTNARVPPFEDETFINAQTFTNNTTGDVFFGEDGSIAGRQVRTVEATIDSFSLVDNVTVTNLATDPVIPTTSVPSTPAEPTVPSVPIVPPTPTVPGGGGNPASVPEPATAIGLLAIALLGLSSSKKQSQTI